jgi:hypothetical protein
VFRGRAEAVVAPRDDPREEARRTRHARLVDDIRQRLGPACADWDPREFDALVHRIAQQKARWADEP